MSVVSDIETEAVIRATRVLREYTVDVRRGMNRQLYSVLPPNRALEFATGGRETNVEEAFAREGLRPNTRSGRAHFFCEEGLPPW